MHSNAFSSSGTNEVVAKETLEGSCSVLECNGRISGLNNVKRKELRTNLIYLCHSSGWISPEMRFGASKRGELLWFAFIAMCLWMYQERKLQLSHGFLFHAADWIERVTLLIMMKRKEAEGYWVMLYHCLVKSISSFLCAEEQLYLQLLAQVKHASSSGFFLCL